MHTCTYKRTNVRPSKIRRLRCTMTRVTMSLFTFDIQRLPMVQMSWQPDKSITTLFPVLFQASHRRLRWRLTQFSFKDSNLQELSSDRILFLVFFLERKNIFSELVAGEISNLAKSKLERHAHRESDP